MKVNYWKIIENITGENFSSRKCQFCHLFSNRGALLSVLRFGALIVCLLVYPSYLFVKVLRMRVMTSGVSLTLLSDRVFVGTSGLHLDFVTTNENETQQNLTETDKAPPPVHRSSSSFLFFVDHPLSFSDPDDHCTHTTESTPHNSNGHSVVVERVSRSNQNNPIDTPRKHDRNAFTTSSKRPTPFRSPADSTTTQTL